MDWATDWASNILLAAMVVSGAGIALAMMVGAICGSIALILGMVGWLTNTNPNQVWDTLNRVEPPTWLRRAAAPIWLPAVLVFGVSVAIVTLYALSSALLLPVHIVNDAFTKNRWGDLVALVAFLCLIGAVLRAGREAPKA